MIAQLWHEGYRVMVRFPYDPDVIADVKTLPDRKWHADRKAWSVPGSFEDDLRRVLVAHGLLTGPRGGPRAVRSSLVEALETVFREVPAELRDPIHRALVRVAHPDTGGTHEIAIAVNQAWERVG